MSLIGTFVADRRDERILGARDVGRLLELPVLLSLPGQVNGRPPRLAAPRSEAGQRFAEFARALAGSLREGSQVVLVAGTDRGTGGVIAANLASTLARARREVVLVCATADDGTAPGLLGVRGGRGLADVLAGRATVREVACGPIDTPGLRVITPGAGPAGPSGPAASDARPGRLAEELAGVLIAQLRRDAHYVVIEARADEAADDALTLAKFADAAVIAVEATRTSSTAADWCIRRIRQLGTPVLGAAVLTTAGRG